MTPWARRTCLSLASEPEQDDHAAAFIRQLLAALPPAPHPWHHRSRPHPTVTNPDAHPDKVAGRLTVEVQESLREKARPSKRWF